MLVLHIIYHINYLRLHSTITTHQLCMYCIFRLPSILTHQHTNLSFIYQAEIFLIQVISYRDIQKYIQYLDVNTFTFHFFQPCSNWISKPDLKLDLIHRSICIKCNSTHHRRGYSYSALREIYCVVGGWYWDRVLLTHAIFS